MPAKLKTHNVKKICRKSIFVLQLLVYPSKLHKICKFVPNTLANVAIVCVRVFPLTSGVAAGGIFLYDDENLASTHVKCIRLWYRCRYSAENKIGTCM